MLNLSSKRWGDKTAGGFNLNRVSNSYSNRRSILTLRSNSASTVGSRSSSDFITQRPNTLKSLSLAVLLFLLFLLTLDILFGMASSYNYVLVCDLLNESVDVAHFTALSVSHNDSDDFTNLLILVKSLFELTSNLMF